MSSWDRQHPAKPTPPSLGNTAGAPARQVALSRRLTLTTGANQTTTGDFSVLGIGRLIVTIRQTAGPPGGVARLTETLQGQFISVIDDVTIAAVGVTYRIDLPITASTASVAILTPPAGAVYEITLQGAGST